MQPATFMIPSFEECPSRGFRRVTRDQNGVPSNEENCPVANNDTIETTTTTTPAPNQTNSPPAFSEFSSMQEQRQAWLQARQRSNATTAASCFSKIDELMKTLPSSLPSLDSKRSAFDRFQRSEGSMEFSTRTLQAGNLSSSDLSISNSLGFGTSTRTLQVNNRSSADLNVSIPELAELSSVRNQRGLIPREEMREKAIARRSRVKNKSNSNKSRSPRAENRTLDPGEQRSGSKSPRLIVKDKSRHSRSKSPWRVDLPVAGRERKSRSKSPKVDSSKKKKQTRDRSVEQDTRTRRTSKRSKSRKRGASRSKSTHRRRSSRDEPSPDQPICQNCGACSCESERTYRS